MKVLIHRTPLLRVSKGNIELSSKSINYFIILDDNVELSNYYMKFVTPKTTIIMNDYRKVLDNEFSINNKPVADFEITVASKELFEELKKFKLKNKNLHLGVVDNHELINELMNKTPIIINKDSIQDGLKILEIKESVSDYEQVCPQVMLDKLVKVRESINLIKPLKSLKGSPLIIKISSGLEAVGEAEDLNYIKKHLLIKHYNNSQVLSFNKYGESKAYTLDELGLITNQLLNMWT